MSEFQQQPQLPKDLPDNPMQWAADWLAHAFRDSVQRNPNSMTLATVDANGRPSARIVLCKDFVADPGYVVFFTNYRSRKGSDIDSDDRVALVFHWDAWGRQIRIEGRAQLAPADESDRYFATRDRGSQLGAWGSDQSQPLASRDAFIEQLDERAARFGEIVDRPPHWGGYRIWADAVELWVEGADRIHDRARWTRTLEATADAYTPGIWQGTRLQP